MTSTFTLSRYLLTLVSMSLLTFSACTPHQPSLPGSDTSELGRTLDLADTLAKTRDLPKLARTLHAADSMLDMLPGDFRRATYSNNLAMLRLMRGENADTTMQLLKEWTNIARAQDEPYVLARLLHSTFNVYLFQTDSPQKALPYMVEAQAIRKRYGYQHELAVGYIALSSFFSDVVYDSERRNRYVDSAVMFFDPKRDPSQYVNMLYTESQLFADRLTPDGFEKAKQIIHSAREFKEAHKLVVQEGKEFLRLGTIMYNQFSVMPPGAMDSTVLDSAEWCLREGLRRMRDSKTGENRDADFASTYLHLAKCSQARRRYRQSLVQADSSRLYVKGLTRVNQYKRERILCEAYGYINQSRQAALHAHEAHQIAVAMHDWELIAEARHLLAESYKIMPNLDSAFLWSTRKAIAQDSLLVVQKKAELIKAEVTLGLHQAEAELTEQQAKLRRQRYYLWATIGLGLLGVALSGWLAMHWLRRLRRLDALRFTAELDEALAKAQPEKETADIGTSPAVMSDDDPAPIEVLSEAKEPAQANDGGIVVAARYATGWQLIQAYPPERIVYAQTEGEFLELTEADGTTTRLRLTLKLLKARFPAYKEVSRFVCINPAYLTATRRAHAQLVMEANGKTYQVSYSPRVFEPENE